MNRKPFLGYPSIATYIRISLESDPPHTKAEIMAPLLAEGYTLMQAQALYDNTLRRYQELRMEQARKEGVVVD
jgi:hypothetical protein